MASSQCAVNRLASGHAPFTIAAIGSSITAGRKHDSYPRALAEQITRRYPRANVSVYNAGYPGANLNYLAACLDRLLPAATADVFIVEVLGAGAFDNTAHGAVPSERLSHLYDAEELIFELYRRAPLSTVVLLARA